MSGLWIRRILIFFYSMCECMSFPQGSNKVLLTYLITYLLTYLLTLLLLRWYVTMNIKWWVLQLVGQEECTTLNCLPTCRSRQGWKWNTLSTPAETYSEYGWGSRIYPLLPWLMKPSLTQVGWVEGRETLRQNTVIMVCFVLNNIC